MKRKVLIVLGGVVVVVVIGGLIALIVPPAVPVADVEQRQVVSTLLATGFVEPVARIPLASEVVGQVRHVNVEEGDQVETGQMLVELVDEESRLSVAQADAAVDEARARLSAVVDQGAPTALQDVHQATLNLEAAQEEYERARQMVDDGVGTEAEVDERRRQVDQARTEVNRAQTRYRETADGGSSHDEAVAQLERAQAELDLARYRREQHRIVAPEAGVVLERNVEEGSTAQSGEPLIVVAPVEPVDIRLAPDERELANLEVGQPAQALADAFDERSFEARVHRIDPSVDPEAGTITAILRVNDGPDYLRPDMTVTVEVETGRSDQDSLVVPRAAVRDFVDGDPYVLLLEGRRARRAPVTVGLSDERFVEITDGLEAADLVIIDEGVESGDRVRRGDEFHVPDDPDEAGEPPGLPEPPGSPQAQGESP
jgi:HlyD family secretion protein